MFRLLPSSLFVLYCSKLTQNWTHRGTKALLLLTNPAVSHLLFLFVWTRCIHVNISGISWAADTLSPVTCCFALVCATAYDGVFVYVLSLNKAAGSGGRWEHALWSCQGGSLSHKWRRCPPQVALMFFWSWQIFNINHFFLSTTHSSPSCPSPVPQMFTARFAAPGLPVATGPRVPALGDDIIWPPRYPHQSCRLWWVCVSLFCVSGSWQEIWCPLHSCSHFLFPTPEVPCWLSGVWHEDRRDRIWISEGEEEEKRVV